MHEDRNPLTGGRMMRKIFLPVAPLLVCLACFSMIAAGCASAPEAKPTRTITELWEPIYNADFDFEPFQIPGKPAGYTVGIIKLDFDSESVPPGEWELSPAERAYRSEFIDSFSRGLRKALTAEGMEVRGPFAEYDDMTFHDRSKCDFVLRPKLLVKFEPTRSTLIEELSGFGGPYGEPLIYGRSADRLDAKARLELEIIDPRTRKQLDWRSLNTDTITKSYDQIWSRWVMMYGRNSRSGWRELEYSERKYPNYHNADNATGRALEDIYHDFMPRISDMVSTKEFKQLDKRTRESKERKRGSKKRK
jgi:hypothetical protein